MKINYATKIAYKQRRKKIFTFNKMLRHETGSTIALFVTGNEIGSKKHMRSDAHALFNVT